jgi:hypothetical protein
MAISELLLENLKGISRSHEVRKSGDSTAVALTFDPRRYGEVSRRIDALLAPILERGEGILTDLSAGRVLDLGETAFRIRGGRVLEVYDYDRTSAAFLRLYRLSDGGGKREWVSLYIDENPLTPWWSREEREG